MSAVTHDLPARFAALRERSRRWQPRQPRSAPIGCGGSTRPCSPTASASTRRLGGARACDLDVAAQLVMIKSETDFAVKHVARWMRPRRVRNSAATLGKKCYVLHEPKGVVLNLSTWNAGVHRDSPGDRRDRGTPCAQALRARTAGAMVLREVIERFPPEEFAVFEGGAEWRRRCSRCRSITCTTRAGSGSADW